MDSSLLSKKELVAARIKENTADGKISCHALRKIAEKLKIPYKEAGEVTNELKIKIKNCDLGCF
jgi:LAO/AO transport system kinase